MTKEQYEKERVAFEKWFWDGKGKEALTHFESSSALMLIAWIARAEIDDEEINGE